MAEPDQLSIEAARADFGAAEARFVAVVGGIYADASDASDQIFAIADEFGASKAVEAMLGNVEQFGALTQHATDGYVADMADALEEAMEAALDARDRLDLATTQREAARRSVDPGHKQVVNINGREFVLDPQRRELRAVDVPTERYQLAEPPELGRGRDANQQPTLTEQYGRDGAVPLAQPSKDRTPPRSR